MCTEQAVEYKAAEISPGQIMEALKRKAQASDVKEIESPVADL